MNKDNIEALALEHGVLTKPTPYDLKENELRVNRMYSGRLEKIEAFAKALQGSGEAVAEVRCRGGEVFGFIGSRVHRDMLPLGTKLFTSPPNTSAKLDKAVEAIERSNEILKGEGIYPDAVKKNDEALQAIRSEG